VWFEWAHRALNDVKATIKLFEELNKKFKKLSKEKKHLLFYIFNKSEDKNIWFLREHLFENIDSNLAFTDFEKKLLKHIWKLDTEEKLIIDKKIGNKNMSKKFDNIDWVEKRENQLKMTNMIMDSFNRHKKVVIEAPTWLWKSFAYLIPSITHSVKTGEKVFISTKTKTLQDQLYSKDLATLKDKLWSDFRFTKLKWKSNYLSVKLYFDEFWLDDLTYSKVWFLSKILLWLYTTKYWELDELNYFWQEFSFIRNINSDNFSVLSEKNDYRRYEFLFKARTKLESSNVIIINHSLLFSDLNQESWVLWKIKNLVIDEWHNIEDSVTDSLRKKYNLNNLSESFDLIEKTLNKIEAKKITFLKLKESLISKLELLDDYAFNYLNNKVWSQQNFKLTLLEADFFDDIDYWNLLKKIELDFIDIVDNLSIREWHDFTKEIALLQSFLDIIKTTLDKKSDKEFIRILSFNDRNGMSFEYTLLNPWEYLRDNLWNKLSSCILTSATLQIWWKFDYFKTLLFLDDFNFHSFESDFDYKKQATLFIPTDIWNIKSNSNEVVDFLWKFYSIVRWKVLTLLTSYNIIKKIYTSLNWDLKKEGINIYAQWIAWSKIKLLSFFLDNPDNSILLGTDSFWEWVDIPWEDLKYLIIHKFPFSVPTDPIFQARSVFFKDPFLEYSVPKAIIKLKQWFWRLIRTKKDNWIVVLLDNRIISTFWGEKFFDAFPEGINIKKGKIDQFLDVLKSKS
jgi:Rad3-related DNA helicase